MSNLSVGLNCPTCGGAITVMDGDRSINCRYCGSTLYVEGDQGVSTIAFKNNITRDVATNAVKEWWKKGFKARDLRHVGTITEIYPIYLPFWSIGTRVAGWVCGYEERTYTDSKGHTRTEREYKEEMVLQDVYSEIACDPGDLGLRSMNNFDGKASFEDLDMILHSNRPPAATTPLSMLVLIPWPEGEPAPTSPTSHSSACTCLCAR